MSSESLLSTEISHCRALAVSGVNVQDVVFRIKRWLVQVTNNRKKNRNESLLFWGKNLCHVIEESLPLGAPIGVLLKEVHPLIRTEEKNWKKLGNIEKQFGFQGAIAVVLPWAVAAIVGGLKFDHPQANLFFLCGIFLQAFGLFTFYWFIKNIMKRKQSEKAWLFHFMVSIWMRTLSGFSLYTSIETVLNQLSMNYGGFASQFVARTLPSVAFASYKSAGRSSFDKSSGTFFSQSWKSWLTIQTAGLLTKQEWTWPKMMPSSASFSIILKSLLENGAPANDVLSNILVQLDEERQNEVEEKLNSLPTKFSLAFCIFFTPAIFLIFIGALWPNLSGFLI